MSPMQVHEQRELKRKEKIFSSSRREHFNRDKSTRTTKTAQHVTITPPTTNAVKRVMFQATNPTATIVTIPSTDRSPCDSSTAGICLYHPCEIWKCFQLLCYNLLNRWSAPALLKLKITSYCRIFGDIAAHEKHLKWRQFFRLLKAQSACKAFKEPIPSVVFYLLIGKKKMIHAHVWFQYWWGSKTW